MKLPAHLLDAMRIGGGLAVALSIGCKTTPRESVKADPIVTVTASAAPSTSADETKWVVETKTMGMSAPPPGDFSAAPPATVTPVKAAPPMVATPKRKVPKHECLACGMG